MTNNDNNKTDRYQIVAKGALVNVLGIIGKTLTPVFFVVVTRFYGPAVMGSFYLAYVLIEMTVSLSVSGFNDGVLMFASSCVDDENRQKDLYEILANGFVVTLFLSIVIIVAVHCGAADLALQYYHQPGILQSIKKMSLAVPFMVLPVMVISATKSLVIMKWDSLLMGLLKPLFLTISAIIFAFSKPDMHGLIWGFILSHVALTLISVFVFRRYFSYSKLFAAIWNFHISKELIYFAIPQNLNMTFNRFITSLDVLMLGFFEFKTEIIGFYAVGAQIARSIRQPKLAFSASYAPIIARLHARGDITGMNDSFTAVSRWTISFGLIIALLILVFRHDLLVLFHASFDYDSTFLLILLIPPLLSCAFGLAGNIIVMTGHVRWNLFNSIMVAGTNLFFNWMLIPEYGIIGAAIATLLASGLISLLQLIEAYAVTGAKMRFTLVYKPIFAAFPAVLIYLAIIRVNCSSDILFKIPLGILVLAIYTSALLLLRLESMDKELVLAWININLRKPA